MNLTAIRSCVQSADTRTPARKAFLAAGAGANPPTMRLKEPAVIDRENDVVRERLLEPGLEFAAPGACAAEEGS